MLVKKCFQYMGKGTIESGRPEGACETQQMPRPAVPRATGAGRAEPRPTYLLNRPTY